MGQYLKPTHDSHSLTIRDDEIDLLELLKALKQNIGLILFISGFIALLAVCYALLSPSIYQASALVGKPTPAMLHQIDNGAKIHSLAPENEYQRFYRTLINQDLQKQFYLEHLASKENGDKQVSTQKAFEGFRKKLTISKNEKSRKVSHENIQISITSENAEEAYQTLTAFLTYMNKAALQAVRSDYMATLDATIKQYNKEIDQLISSKQRNIQNEITRLRESVELAKSLGIKSNQISDSTGLNALSSDDPSVYLLGYEFLEARIKMLQSRKDLIPFIPGVAELRTRLEGFEALEINTKSTRLYDFEKSPTVPYQHIKPRRTLIVILGLMLGIFLGCAAALIKSFITNMKKQPQPDHEEKANASREAGHHHERAEAISYVLSSEYSSSKEKVANASK